MQIFVPEPDFMACARALDLRRLRSQINEALVILRVLRGESTAWRHHPVIRAWRGCSSGVYLYREACRAEYAERTGAVWGVDVEPPGVDYWHEYEDNILPWWWGDEEVHASHRAVLMGKWSEERNHGRLHGTPDESLVQVAHWSWTIASRSRDGKWPYVWPWRRP
jgi:hypothetical protein